MQYATIQNLAKKIGYDELGQRASNANAALINPRLMQLIVESGDYSDFTQNDIANAQNGISAINEALEEASREIDVYLASAVNLPLTTISNQIIDICCRIARYRVARYESGSEDESRIYRDYINELERLKLFATGKLAISGLIGYQPDNTQNTNAVAAYRSYAVIAPVQSY